MPLSVGIVGLPNVGKTTLFNALTRGKAHVASYPFTTIDPNVGVVPVPDRRLADIAAIVRPQRVVPTTVEFVDIAGLVRGASKGEGLGNQFLGHIRNVDALAIVTRYFADPDVAHVYSTVDPVRDIEVIAAELGLADMALVERRRERVQSAAKSGEKRFQEELEVLARLHAHLDQGKPARSFPLAEHEAELVHDTLQGLLTSKPVLYVANVGEADLALAGSVDALVQPIRELAQREGAEVVVICARLEADLLELAEEDAAAYLAEVGLTETGLERLVQASYRLLKLVTFFTTTGGEEVRAWTVIQGTKAPQAAGKVHSDMERGFIRAEAISYEDLMRVGSFPLARERGLLRLEGRDYVVQDGDILHFRFSV